MAYVYTVSVEGEVRYVGKGTGGRKDCHIRRAANINIKKEKGLAVKANKFHIKLAAVVREGKLVTSSIIEDGLTDDEAFAKEIEIIASFPKGQLWNTHKGGKGADSESTKRLWQTPETRSKIIQGLLKAWQDPELRKCMLEIRSDPIILTKISEAATRQWAKPGARAKKSSDMKLFNKEHPEAAKQRGLRIKVLFYTTTVFDNFKKARKEYWEKPENCEEQSRKLAEYQKRLSPKEKMSQKEKHKKCWTPQRRFEQSMRASKQFEDPNQISIQKQNAKLRWKDPEYRAKCLVGLARARQKSYQVRGIVGGK